MASSDQMLAHLAESGQENITRFLSAELDRASKIVAVARTMTSNERRTELLLDVGKTIQMVRSLEGKITDKDAWTRIHARTDEVQRAAESGRR